MKEIFELLGQGLADAIPPNLDYVKAILNIMDSALDASHTASRLFVQEHSLSTGSSIL